MTILPLQIIYAEGDDVRSEDSKEFYDRSYNITLYTKSQKNDKSYKIIAKGYNPYFYVAIPTGMKTNDIASLVYSYVPEKLDDIELFIKKIVPVKKKNIYGSSKEPQKFIKVYCASICAFYSLRKKLSAVQNNINGNYCLELFESSIDPLMQFAHDNELNLSG